MGQKIFLPVMAADTHLLQIKIQSNARIVENLQCEEILQKKSRIIGRFK